VQVLKVVDKIFAEQSRHQAQILTQGDFLLSLSYGRSIPKPRKADDQVVPTSNRVSSTVLLPKPGEVVMACFKVICEDSDLDSGVGGVAQAPPKVRFAVDSPLEQRGFEP
jgi:hypothetical protein